MLFLLGNLVFILYEHKSCMGWGDGFERGKRMTGLEMCYIENTRVLRLSFTSVEVIRLGYVVHHHSGFTNSLCNVNIKLVFRYIIESNTVRLPTCT